MKRSKRLLEKEARKLISKQCGVNIENVDTHYYSFPVLFGSTAGPFRGRIGLHVMTYKQIEAFKIGSLTAIFCEGEFWKIVSDFNLETNLTV